MIWTRLTCYVPQLAQTVVLETSDAVALLALVAGFQEPEHERADDHVAGHQAEQAQVAEQVGEELAHAPPETRFGGGRCRVRQRGRRQQQQRRRRRRRGRTLRGRGSSRRHRARERASTRDVSTAVAARAVASRFAGRTRARGLDADRRARGRRAARTAPHTATRRLNGRRRAARPSVANTRVRRRPRARRPDRRRFFRFFGFRPLRRSVPRNGQRRNTVQRNLRIADATLIAGIVSVI